MLSVESSSDQLKLEADSWVAQDVLKEALKLTQLEERKVSGHNDL